MRTKRTSKVKQKAFFINFKGFLVAKNSLTPERAPLTIETLLFLDVIGVVLVFLFLTSNIFHTFFWCIVNFDQVNASWEVTSVLYNCVNMPIFLFH